MAQSLSTDMGCFPWCEDCADVLYSNDVARVNPE